MNKKSFTTITAVTILVIACLSTNSALAVPALTPGLWENIGPSAGSGYGATFVRVDHSHPDTIYVTVDQSGLWRTTDRGDTWALVGTPSETNFSDSVTFLDSPLRVYVDPNNPKHLYASQGVRGGTPTVKSSADRAVCCACSDMIVL